jgi:hypothetical protein
MQLTPIVNQLKAVLPRYTDDFSTNLSITSLARSSSTVTATTSAAHGLIAGDKILIVGAKTPISISSLTRINQTIAGIETQYALALCATKHNLTKNNLTVEISGADQAGYNGTFDLVWTPPAFTIASITINTSTNVATITTVEDNGFISNANFEIQIFGSVQDAYNVKTSIASIVDSKTFTISGVYGVYENGSRAPSKNWQVKQVLNAYTFIYEVTGSPVTPATGTPTQIYQYQTGYNGYKTVVTAPTTTTFTYAITTTPNSPAQGTISGKVYPTITGAISYDRAVSFYETQYAANQSKKWIIAVLGNTSANKNERNKTDALTYGDRGNFIREQTIQNITLYFFLPCGNVSDQLMYIATRDLAESYKPYIYRALLGFQPPSDLTQTSYSQLMFVSSDYVDFNGGYYVHQYIFQATVYLNQSDAVAPEDLSAFREFDFDVYNEGAVVMNINGELDEGN